jgi:hypothetical protein
MGQGHTSAILATENAVNYSLKFIRLVLNGDATTVEVKKDAEVAYTQDIQQRLKGMVWQSGGCHSWYYRKDGWNSTMYPSVIGSFDCALLTWTAIRKYTLRLDACTPGGRTGTFAIRGKGAWWARWGESCGCRWS